MDQVHSMRVFLSVVDSGGFARASRKLGISPAAVTRAVAEIENHLGVALLVRTTRVVRVTDAGARYAADCRRILVDLSEADRAATEEHGVPSGKLTVTASVLFGNMHVGSIVTDYLRTFPLVQVTCLFTDRIVNIDEDGVDVAIRIGELGDSSLRASRVGAVRRILCAAPTYLAARGAPRHPDELVEHTVIAATGLTPSPQWRFVHAGRPIVCEVRPRMMTTTNDSAISAAVAGFGITRVMSYQVADQLNSGALMTVLPDYETGPVPVHVIHSHGRRPSAKVRAFVDMTVARLRGESSLN